MIAPILRCSMCRSSPKWLVIRLFDWVDLNVELEKPSGLLPMVCESAIRVTCNHNFDSPRRGWFTCFGSPATCSRIRAQINEDITPLHSQFLCKPVDPSKYWLRSWLFDFRCCNGSDKISFTSVKFNINFD